MQPAQTDKSGDEFDEIDQDVDGLGFEDEDPYDRQNEGIVSNLALANINQDIEEIAPMRAYKKNP
jgi:hypothetical protein